MARTQVSPLAEQKQSMRRLAHQNKVASMREGRILRPVTIPSGKRYKRKPKYQEA